MANKHNWHFCNTEWLSELEFLKSLWGLGTEEEEGYRTGPPGYIGWRNSFLGIDSGAPYTFKNTGSGHGLSLFLFLAGKPPAPVINFPHNQAP
jgi:hypothetical protein